MTPERPVFFEGQILAAADLTGSVDYGRGEVARHERYLHDWGIAEGLQMTAKADSTGKFVDVTFGSGVAIDGTGREIIVSQAVMLDPDAFFAANGASPKAKANYPILLHGVDTAAPAPPLATGACGTGSQSTRTQELFGLTYGALGAELHLDEQPLPDLGVGPGRPDGLPWEVLVGFVQWDAAAHKFTAATQTGVRYAGVKADTVAARGGTLELRSQPTATPGQPVLSIGGDPPLLTFGLYQGGGSIDARLTVTAQGDVTAHGTIQGALNPGDIRAQSGTATHGLVIPLPEGITQDQVDRGAVILHLHLTPHTPQSSAAGSWYVPVDCSVDAHRRLSCQVMLGAGSNVSGNVRPGIADYLIVAAANGGAP
jgi:hypothetical protein